MAPVALYVSGVGIEFRGAAEEEPFPNYLGFLEVEPDEDAEVANAHQSDTLAGSIVYDIGRTESGVVSIRRIYVRPENRERGIGRMRADHAITDAVSPPCVGYLVDSGWTLPWLQDGFARRFEETAREHAGRGR